MAQAQAQEVDSSFKQWYEDNKEDYNAKRRKRYKMDPAYRKTQLKSAKNWRKSNPRRARTPKPVTAAKYSISQAAEQIGTCAQTIRSIEKRGLIPKAKKGSGHRSYTQKQSNLMAALIEYLQQHHYREAGYAKEVAKLSKSIKANWNK